MHRLDQFLGDPLSVERQGGTPLAPHLASFAASLRDDGYSPLTVQSKLRLLSQLGQWLGRNDLQVAALEEGLVGASFEEHRRGDRSARSHAQTARQFLDHLRTHDVVPAPPPPVLAESPLLSVLGQYEKHLRAERGLTSATVVNYLPVVRRFLTERFGEGSLPLWDLSPADIRRQSAELHLNRACVCLCAQAEVYRSALKSVASAEIDRPAK